MPAALLAFSLLLPAHASDAQIVSLLGKGETHGPDSQDWRRAVLQQSLTAGDYVRTLDFSQMALLLSDQTQLRLNQNSLLQVKSLVGAGQPTRLLLKSGRSWMQRKGTDTRAQAGQPAVLEIETPNAIAAIRGTDWELVVQDSGIVTLTVFSGEAEFYNPYGRISVAANEQASVEPGKAPVKILLTQARDRIQWVTAYQPQPMRWGAAQLPEGPALSAAIEAGRYGDAFPQLERAPLQSAASAAVLADLLLAQGRVDEAIRLLETARGRFPDAAEMDALLSRAYVIAGRADDAARLLANARTRHPRSVEGWLARGDLARYEGRAAEANVAYGQVLTLDDGNAPALFGLGVVASEREYVRRARDYLGEALQRAPQGPGYQGELGTLETFADHFPAASQAFEAALRDKPDDYAALTGLGLMQLKRGETDAALASFLKANVIEPRYGRAVLYAGVAYYQQGKTYAAEERFRRAAELDPRDPLPYILLSVVANDAIEPGEAVEAAHAAIQRLPYLKSLNQLLNNQKGSANVGAALAAFGLEEWAQQYAYASYNPYWAGSHLFLADRFNGTFNKNSELFQGFLSDPTVFGASNRFSSLLPRPGDYVTLTAGALHQSAKVTSYDLIVNGYHNQYLPLAYFVEQAGVSARPATSTLDGDVGLTTLGLGFRPRHDVGVFLFANQERLDSLLTDPANGFFRTPQEGRNARADLGINIKFSPDSQSWFKAGSGQDKRLVNGLVTDTVGYDLFSAVFPSVTFSDRGDYVLRNKVKAHDAQWRHVVDVSPRWQLGLGIESGQQSLPVLSQQYLPTNFGLFYYGLRERTDHRTTDVSITNRFQLRDSLLLQLDLTQQRLKKHFEREQFYGVVDLFEESQARGRDEDIKALNPRAGLAWQPVAGQTLRLAWQKWRRPAMQNSLGPIDTAGIPLDDRLVAIGGSLQRARVQYELALDERSFVSVFADRRKIDNLLNPGGTLVTGTELDTLERLRKLFTTGQGAVDYYEGTPDFAAGKVSSAGLAANRILSPRLAVSGAYVYQESRNTAGGTAYGNAIPLLPRHLAQLGMTWVALPRLKFDAIVLYRSSRFVDEANSAELASGWNGSLRANWESADKQFGVTLRAENLLSRPAAGFDHKALLGLLLSWRL
ncbi:hypothetical protein GCM10027296_39010 [Chitinimonas naiadis]